MAVFTAIATAILGAFGVAGTIMGSAVLFNVAVGVIATGLAVGTAKLFGIYDVPKIGDSRDPGIKIQLAPSTDNKVPKLYGRNYTGSLIIDAEIKNQNKTMAYAMVISEYSDNDTWTVNNIYRGDARLNFGSGPSGHIVQSVTDPNATASNKVTGKMRCRVYAGGSEAVNQIFPTTNKVAAYTMFNNWTASNTMEDLVFAIFEIDYEPEEGLTGLGAITYDINNALNEPSNVLLDYLQNDRYGAGISNTMIDTTSFNNWNLFCTEQVDYVNTANVTAQHDRYQIDGALSTFTSAKNNINKICLSGGAFFTYNAKLGKFGVVPNRAATTAEQANAFILNDDNIISKLEITSTELYSLYNKIEVEYPSVNQKDQTDVYFGNVNADIRNPNEPDNTLSYRLEMCNDRARVASLANIDLNQSRVSKVIQCTADYSALQIDVGDVIKLTSDLYGFSDKLFRAMRVTEQEGEDGMLTCKLLLLEYDDDIYGDIIEREDLPQDGPGIPNWWVNNSNTVLTLGNITVVNDPDAANANVHNPVTGSVIGTSNMNTVRNEFGSMFTGDGVFINVPIEIPSNTTFNTAKVVCINESANASTPAVFIQDPATAASGNASYFESNSTYNFGIDSYSFSPNTTFRMEVSLEDTISGSASRRFVTGSLQVNKQNIVKPNDLAQGSSGVKLTLDLPHIQLDAANLSPANASGSSDMVEVKVFEDWYITGERKLANIDPFFITPGEFDFNKYFGNTAIFQGDYTYFTSCFFTGLITSPTVSVEWSPAIVTFQSGNMISDYNLVANVDYVTDANNIILNNLATSTATITVLQDDANNDFSFAVMQKSSGVFNVTEASTLTNNYPFKIFPTTAYIHVLSRGASSIDSPDPTTGKRGFSTFYDVTATRKGGFNAFLRSIFPDA
jgi:hypothetical protein